MSAAEEAENLIFKYYDLFGIKLENSISMYEAAHCALEAIDRVILYLPFTDLETSLGRFCEEQRNYLEQVRHEIKKYEGVQ
jgi:GTP1/Obg family GTP-binding protein